MITKRRIMKIQWQNIPFAPRRCPFFYGWVIVAISTLSILASIPGQTMGVGVFTDPMSEIFGISRLNLTKAYLFGTLGSSLILPLAGKLLDRIGVRAMTVFSALGLAISLILISYGSLFIRGNSLFLDLTLMSFCFMLIRFFGQGCLTMTPRVAIGKWFHHHRGRAVAIMSVLTSFGLNYSPRYLNGVLGTYGFKYSYVFMALIFGVVMAVIGWVFFRDNPEKCGLLMDGGKATDPEREDKTGDTLKDFTRKEALKTFSFWVLSATLGAFAFFATAVVFHMATIAEEFNLDRQTAYSVFLPMSIFGIVASFTGSLLSDKIRFKWIVMAMMFAQAAGLAGLTIFDLSIGKVLIFFGLGVAGGLVPTITAVGLPKYFGRGHLGAISGLNMSIMVFSSAVGPFLFSYLAELSGSYVRVIAVMTSIPIALFFATFYLKNPQQ